MNFLLYFCFISFEIFASWQKIPVEFPAKSQTKQYFSCPCFTEEKHYLRLFERVQQLPNDMQKEIFDYTAAAMTQDFKDIHDSKLIGKFYVSISSRLKSSCIKQHLVGDYGITIPKHLRNVNIEDKGNGTYVIISPLMELETSHISGPNKNGYFVIRFHLYKHIKTHYYALIDSKQPIKSCLKYTIGQPDNARGFDYRAIALHHSKNVAALLTQNCCLRTFSWGSDFTKYAWNNAPSAEQHFWCFLNKMEFVGNSDVLSFISNGYKTPLLLFNAELGQTEKFQFNYENITKVYPIQKISFEDIKQLALIAMAWDWLSADKKSKEQGKEILRLFKDETLIPNRHKLIWRTTTPEYGNLFKRIYEILTR